MPDRIEVPTSELQRLYEEEKLNLREIAARVGLTYQAINYRLHEFKIRRKKFRLRDFKKQNA